MKNRGLSKFTAIVLLITIVTLIAIAGTYAKYTSSFYGGGTATAADWNIQLSGGEGTYSQTFSLESSEQVYPGGSGTLGTVTVQNNSTLVNASVTDVQIIPDSSTPANLTLTPNYYSGTFIGPNSTGDFSIDYTWTYDDTDETSYAGQTITFTVTLTVDQVEY